MKKVGLFLLAVVMMVGVAGCGGGDDFSPNYSNMAGVYTPTKITGIENGTTITLVPPDISGTFTLEAAGTFSMDISIKGVKVKTSGSYGISGDTIIFGDGSGPITDDGRKFTITGEVDGVTLTMEFTRS
jgi:hypothetical protein